MTLSRLIRAAPAPFLHCFAQCFAQLDYERLARLLAEISTRRAHLPRSLTEAEQVPFVHAPSPGAERFQVQLVFAGKVVHYGLPTSTNLARIPGRYMA